MLVNESHKHSNIIVLYVDMEQKEFETEIRRIRKRLLQEAMRYLMDSEEAEDVTQETVLKLWSMRKDLEQYRSIEGLAIIMVRRMAINRRQKVVNRTDWNDAQMQTNDTPETDFISKEEDERVMRLIARLPDAQQTVLRMKHIDGLETKEIAQITGCSEVAIRSNLSKARKKIMKMFKIR